MSSCLESYRICCRCATADLPDFIMSDVRPSSDCLTVLDSFLRHFNLNLSQSDLAVVALIFSGRRLNVSDSVGAVFGSVPVSPPPRPQRVALTHALHPEPLCAYNYPACLSVSAQAQAAAGFSFVRRSCARSRKSAQVHAATALLFIRPKGISRIIWRRRRRCIAAVICKQCCCHRRP